MTPDNLVTPDNSIGEFYSDIESVLTSIGEGLASAQRVLDIGAMETQKKIWEDDTLSGYGLTATWYAMPEAEFTIKMEISTSTEETVEFDASGKATRVPRTRIKAAMSNAKYNSLYKTDTVQESTLRVRFVPVPMPERLQVPNVVGLDLESARAALGEASVNAFFTDKSGEVWTAGDGMVIAQSIPGGELITVERMITAIVRDKTAAEKAAGVHK
ncbi:MAG: PASTA domain-containing protein [Methanomassiliicoccaceae archaeon]|nr:PASTA domain-containing protein [Methanomassiliicoccaceae archaeon]